MKNLLITLVGAAFFFGANSASGQGHPIIDMHVHAYGANTSAPVPCYVPCENPPAAAATDEELLHATISAMDEHNIVLAYLIGYRRCTKSGKRLRRIASLDPWR